MIGAIIGDIVGSVHEFKSNPTKTKDFGDLIINSNFKNDVVSHFTDDTVCSVAIAEWLTSHQKETPDFYLRKYGKLYPKRGYGGMFGKWLDDPKAGPYNSWGNGAPMRVSAVGHYAVSLDEAYDLAMKSAEVTHNHPQAIKGAQFVAGFIYLCNENIEGLKTPLQIVDQLLNDLDEDRYYASVIHGSTLDDIRPSYKFQVSAKNTVPQAVKCVLEATSFEDVIRNAISLGGDADTLAAIAGSMGEMIWDIEDELITSAMRKLDDQIKTALADFFIEALTRREG